MSFNYYSEKYKRESQQLKNCSQGSGKSVKWQSPSNIALIKYWGKHGNQLPDNATISFTLSKTLTQTEVKYLPGISHGNQINFYYDGRKNTLFETKIAGYINQITEYLPFLKQLQLEINSVNTFPHSAGIASSASSYSALALCLVSIENELFGTLNNVTDFLNKASFLSRLGSGSACRSVHGPATLWGYIPEIIDSTNELAIPISSWLHPVFKNFNNAILVADSSAKEISSTAGHKMMNHHFYKEGRLLQATHNLGEIIKALQNGDLELFAKIVENEALSLHALILSANPGHILLKPATLAIIHQIRQFRDNTGLPCTFTIDAGPNIHLLYPETIKNEIREFVINELMPLCENGLWIDDTLSDGPLKI